MSQTLLVTGGAGYIGSVTAQLLLRSGYRVLVLDSLETGRRQAVPAETTFIQGDLRDAGLLDAVMRDEPIDAVVHFAAYSQVGESVRNPDRYFNNNVHGGHTLLNAMRDHGVGRIVFSSTAAVYGNPEQVPIIEQSRTAPVNAYGRSKLAFEYLLHSYEEAYGIRHAVLRYFNACGATETHGEDHDPETHLIPLTLQVALGQREAISIFGTDYDTPDGTCIRDYIHVADLADAHRRALERITRQSLTCNLGNGRGFSVREVIETCRTVTGHEIPAVACDRRPGDPARLTASAKAAEEQLGWRPQHRELRDIIESAWQWHQAHPNGYGRE